MTDPVNKMAPEVTGVNKLVDWVVQKLNPQWFSTAGRTFVETAQGTKTPISEKNFSPAELKTLRDMIALKGGDEGTIQYRDYMDYANHVRKQGGLVSSVSPGLMSMGDPMGNLQTTLGRFRYARDSNGNLTVVDTYDFNPPMVAGSMQEARTGDYGALGPYGLIRDYAGEKIPPGYGRPININLGK